MICRDIRPLPEINQRQFTVADLAVLPADLPTGAVRYELDDGRLLCLPPHDDPHGAVSSNLVAIFVLQAVEPGLGKARCGGVGVILGRRPDRVVGADLLFVGNGSLPIRLSAEDYLETIPDIAVEVVSKNDTRPYVQRKVDDYLAAGVKEVWVAWPAERTIVVHRSEAEPVTYGEEQELTTPIIPGFLLRVADAFVL
jgi:Uma2 family endonuclease